jgi:hypothetical protein
LAVGGQAGAGRGRRRRGQGRGLRGELSARDGSDAGGCDRDWGTVDGGGCGYGDGGCVRESGSDYYCGVWLPGDSVRLHQLLGVAASAGIRKNWSVLELHGADRLHDEGHVLSLSLECSRLMGPTNAALAEFSETNAFAACSPGDPLCRE